MINDDKCEEIRDFTLPSKGLGKEPILHGSSKQYQFLKIILKVI